MPARRAKSDCPWIVAKEGLVLECERCGQTWAPKLPMAMLDYVKAGEAFTVLHRDCEPREGAR